MQENLRTSVVPVKREIKLEWPYVKNRHSGYDVKGGLHGIANSRNTVDKTVKFNGEFPMNSYKEYKQKINSIP